MIFLIKGGGSQQLSYHDCFGTASQVTGATNATATGGKSRVQTGCDRQHPVLCLCQLGHYRQTRSPFAHQSSPLLSLAMSCNSMFCIQCQPWNQALPFFSSGAATLILLLRKICKQIIVLATAVGTFANPSVLGFPEQDKDPEQFQKFEPLMMDLSRQHILSYLTDTSY